MQWPRRHYVGKQVGCVGDPPKWVRSVVMEGRHGSRAAGDSILIMSSTPASENPAAATATSRSTPAHSVSVLLYSDDITTRDAVRVGVGRRPARDVEIVR